MSASAAALGSLALLALRRAAPLAWLALAFLLALCVARSARSFEPLELLAAERGLLDAGLFARAAARASAFALFVPAAAPALLLAAARLGAGIAGEEGGWLRARAARPRSASVALAAGVLAAGLGAVTLALFAAELGRGAHAPILGACGALRPPASLERGPWLDAHRPLRVEGLAPPPASDVLGLELALGAGAPVVAVAGRLRSADGRASEARARVLGRGELLLALPGGEPPFTLELELEHPSAALRVLPDSLAGWRTLPSERIASSFLALHAGLAASWIVLALGLGAWLRPSLAAALAASLFLAVLLGDAPPWLPGASLGGGFELLGRGRAPAPPQAATCAAAVALASSGWALVAAGLARGGSRARSARRAER